MEKWIRYLFIFLIAIIGLPGLIYLGLAIYYQDSFMYGTWINGIYCTGKTVDEVEKELLEQFQYEEVTVNTPQGAESITREELEISLDFKTALEEYRIKQNPFVWISRMITGHQNEEVLPVITFNEEKLEQWIYKTKSYRKNLDLKEDSLSILLTKEGYVIEENKEEIFNIVYVKEILEEAIKNAEEEIDLKKDECFFTRDETLEMQQTREFYEKVLEFQNLSLTYKMKEEERKVKPSEVAKWLKTNDKGEILLSEKGNFVLDKEAITEFVDWLAEEFDTWQNYHFITHDGREIFINKGNYGTKINKEKEVIFLINYLKEPKKLVREPEYSKDFTYENRNQIDRTYVEVDLTAQKMFYFNDQKLELETDVVTGCIANGTDTPEMVCYVYGKSRNAILKGRDYRSFVNYWMPVYGGIGVHDATWRDKFGGEIYKKSGSHGCINTPLEAMGTFYEIVEKGTPVVIHY